MRKNQMMIYLTPGPWTLVERRVEGGLLPEITTRPVVCELGEINWQANGRLIAAAPQLLIELRAAARKNKDFATADQIRDQLSRLGVTLEDRPGGTEWTKQ